MTVLDISNPENAVLRAHFEPPGHPDVRFYDGEYFDRVVYGGAPVQIDEVMVLGLNPDGPEHADLDAFVQAFGITFPVPFGLHHRP